MWYNKLDIVLARAAGCEPGTASAAIGAWAAVSPAGSVGARLCPPGTSAPPQVWHRDCRKPQTRAAGFFFKRGFRDDRSVRDMHTVGVVQ